MEPFVPYTPGVAPALWAVWDAATGGGLPLTERLWRERVDNHPLFQPADCLIVPAADGGVAGFALTRAWTPEALAAYPDAARHQDQGHIMALAVHPRLARQGIGSRLLAAAEDRLRAQGATTLCLFGPPGHLIPGPPLDGGTRGFWERAGYQVEYIAADVRRRLDDWMAPPPPPAVAEGEYSYRQGQPGEEAAILAFLQATFPGGWHYDTAQAFARGYRPADMTLLCDRSGAIRGFQCNFHAGSGTLGGGALYYPLLKPDAWGGIGPLGISRTVRGAGLGLGLVAAGVTYLYAQGVRDCGIDWTELIDFYGRLGFAVWKQYTILKKAL